MTHKIPRNEAQAAALLERHAVLEGELAHIDGVRDKLIADANANADASSVRVLKELAEIRSKLEPWWKKAAAALTRGKRKSIELGGCDIGNRKAKDKLVFEGDEDATAEKMAKRPWAESLIVTKARLDKAAILKAMGGANDRQLKALGFKKQPGEETFFVSRVKQGGTPSATA